LPDGPPQEVATPDQRTIAEVSAFLQVEASQLIKSLVYMADDKPVVALVRGDHELHENKLARLLKAEVRPARPEEVLEYAGAEVGFVGPVGLAERGLRIVGDESLRPDGAAGPREYAAGANKPHTHLLGVVPGRDFTAEWADLREAQAGDGCPECGEPLTMDVVIEVGNIFKLGTKYTKPLNATVLDESGQERLIIMGSYGIGPARIAAAAVEQHADERGIVWPKAIAPFDIHLVQVQPKDELQSDVADSLYRALKLEGWDVLWDDRDERPGVKFADAELIGCPIRVTVGKKAISGVVEVQPRVAGDREDVSVDECVEAVRRLWEAAL
jgi:prolyl-tRNA synthetase